MDPHILLIFYQTLDSGKMDGVPVYTSLLKIFLILTVHMVNLAKEVYWEGPHFSDW